MCCFYTGTVTQVDAGANNETTRNNGIMEIVRQENRIDIDEIWNSPPPPSITSRGTDTERQNGRHGTGTQTLPRGTSAGLGGGPRNGLSTSTSLTLGTGNGLGLMLDGIDLSDLWNANTLPGSRNLNSYFP